MPTILCEIDSTGSLTRSYVHANAQVLAMHDGDYTAATVNRYFYLHDRLGSVRMLIDQTAAVKNTYTYNPHGEDIATECATTVANQWKYTGQYHDAEINQYYLRARQYGPDIARFTGRDPIAGSPNEPMTLHVYLYCLNDPINRIDLNGKWSIIGWLGGNPDWEPTEEEADLLWEEFWYSAGKSSAAIVDGLNPFGNNYEYIYANEDGSIDSFYKRRRGLGIASRIVISWYANALVSGAIFNSASTGGITYQSLGFADRLICNMIIKGATTGAVFGEASAMTIGAFNAYVTFASYHDLMDEIFE